MLNNVFTLWTSYYKGLMGMLCLSVSGGLVPVESCAKPKGKLLIIPLVACMENLHVITFFTDSFNFC